MKLKKSTRKEVNVISKVEVVGIRSKKKRIFIKKSEFLLKKSSHNN